MDIIAACLSGIVVKLYDDLTENNIIKEGFIKESLHTLSCFLLAISSTDDFTYSLMLYAMNLAQHYSNSDSFSQLKEKSILYIYPIFLLLTLPSIRQLQIIEIIILLFTCVGSFAEASIIKEDVSVRKLIMRSILIFIFIGMVICGMWFKFMSTSVIKIFLVVIFYFITSCCFQIYELFFKHLHFSLNVDNAVYDNFFNNIFYVEHGIRHS
jgi:hypothetical protein